LQRAEMALTPLDINPDSPWLRQRRYDRIQLPAALAGSVVVPQGRCSLELEELSLGGGVASCQRHLKAGAVAQLEIRTGWNSIQAEVLVREARPQQMSFELVNIDLSDRSRLRRALAGLYARISQPVVA